MNILAVGSLSELYEIVGFLVKIGIDPQESIDVVAILSNDGENHTVNVKKLGVRKAYIITKGFTDLSFRDLAEVIVDIAGKDKYNYIFARSSKLMKEIGFYTAQKLDMPASSEALDIEIHNGKLKISRSIMAGRVIQIEEPMDSAFILLAPRKPESLKLEKDTKEIVEVDISRYEKHKSLRILERKEKKRSTVNLENADIIVSVGRGFKSKDDLKMAFELADLLKGQVGCSRPIAADLKWLPEEHWVGLSGKKVRPKIYIAIGISGQPQHIAGINNAKTIIAINKDPNAPIFKYSDYGIVADLYELVPKLIEKLKKEMS